MGELEHQNWPERGNNEADLMLQSQAAIYKTIFGVADTMALRCAVELRIADIIDAHHNPITLSQIAQGLNSSSPDIACLARIMRFLVRRGIFTARISNSGETLYGLTQPSRCLLRDGELSLAPVLLMGTHPMFLATWHEFSGCVKEGGSAFSKVYGQEVFDFASANPEFNKLFNEGMACTAKITTRAIMSGYKDGFDCIGSLVDVGGGVGSTIAEVVKACPHIKGINFDLPHVVTTAPAHPGVTHVGGDMFEAIPPADAIFMKSVLHDWGDEDCVRILRNVRKAIPEKTGKLIIVDIVLQPDGKNPFDDTAYVFDLVMIARCNGGKERTELEWKELLEEGGFPRYKIIKIPTLQSIIEAYPQ